MKLQVRGYKGTVIDMKANVTQMVAGVSERPVSFEINWYDITLLLEDGKHSTVTLSGVEPHEIKTDMTAINWHL